MSGGLGRKQQGQWREGRPYVEFNQSNYRCFDNHRVGLKPLSVIVGANNAGKSTFAEALRLLSIVVSRYPYLTYNSPPPWTNLPARYRGVSPALKDIDLRGGS